MDTNADEWAKNTQEALEATPHELWQLAAALLERAEEQLLTSDPDEAWCLGERVQELGGSICGNADDAERD